MSESYKKISLKSWITEFKYQNQKIEQSIIVIKNFLNRLRNSLLILLLINIGIFVFVLYHSIESFKLLPENQNLTQFEVGANIIKNNFKCINSDFLLEVNENDNYTILSNYIRASKYYECHESITYTTNGEFRYLDNLVPLVNRWDGPISVAVYAPGSDFDHTLNVIFYLRNCSEVKEKIKERVTFHIFFDKNSNNLENLLYETSKPTFTCADGEKFLKHFPKNETFRAKNKLKFPINVARNMARSAATTYFVLASDIELYPSVNFIEQFFTMIASEELTTEKNVFVLPVLEIKNDVELPNTKQELVKSFKDNKIFWFHQNVCPQCHNIPEPEKWLNDTDFQHMKVIATAKRQEKFRIWEPFYVGTNEDPFFDERLTYEGAFDKMTQAYELCLLDYGFNILSNAFLIHRNGIKYVEEALIGREQREKFLMDVIVPEMWKIYKKNDKCVMI